MLFKEYSTRYPKSFPWRTCAFFVDSVVGKILKSKSNTVNNPKKILVIRKDEIGDQILSIPLYSAIKSALPKSKLYVLCGKPSAPLLENNPYIDKVIPIETIRNSKVKFLKQYFEQIKQIKQEDFDLIIDPKGSILNIILMFLARAKNRLSYWNVSGGKPFLTHPIKYEKEMHDIDANISLLEKYGLKVKKTLPKLYFSKQDKLEAENILKKLPKRYCCAYMTPTSTYKAWTVDKWKNLFSLFPKEKFLIAAREVDRQKIENDFKELNNVQVICIDKLRVLALIFEKAKAIVAVDGGMMHLAWISNPKTISLFGQVDLKLLYPPRGKVICYCPESEQGFNRQPIASKQLNKYMLQITSEEVAKELKEYLR